MGEKTGLSQNPCSSIRTDSFSARLPVALGWAQPHGKNDEVELLILDRGAVDAVPQGHAAAFGPLPEYRGLGPDVADSGHVLGPFIEPFKPLAVGTDIIVEDHRLDLGVVLLGQDHLFCGVHTADRGAIRAAGLLIP